jgi:hypothetical protein
VGGPATVVEVDGEPLAPAAREALRSVAVKSEMGQPTRVYLELDGDVAVEGEGVVHVVRDLDQRQAVRAFLSALDPVELERVALESLGYEDGEAPMTRAVLAAMAAMVADAT